MSSKNKTDLIRISVSAVFAVSAVLVTWIYRQPRFQNIPVFIIAAAVFAFIFEALLLFILKGKNAVKRAIKIILLFVINISVFASAVIYSFSSAVILQPHPDESSYEELKQKSFAEEIIFEGTNGKVNGWFYNKAGDFAPTVLYFYGNYETASTRLLNLSKYYENSAFVGCNFAVFDYPSYGSSEGKCTDETILTFAIDVYDELIKRTDSIIVLGYSVGTGPACYLASEREVDGLILYAPYADGIDLYNNIVDVFHGPLEKLVSFDIKSIEFAKSIEEKTLILCSEKDELIPYTSSMRLVTEFGGECTLKKISGISHNQFLTDSFVKEETANFIREVCEE